MRLPATRRAVFRFLFVLLNESPAQPRPTLLLPYVHVQNASLPRPLFPVNDSATVASWTLAAVLLAGTPLLANPAPASAISGGGLDYAELNLTGKDFSNGKYKSKVNGACTKTEMVYELLYRRC